MSYDVLIVGAGAGGGSSAYAFSRLGFKVLLMDAGPAYDPMVDYRLMNSGWEQDKFPRRGRWPGSYSFSTLQELDPRREDLRSWNLVQGRLHREGQRQPYGYSHVRGIGGSTLHFSGEAHRLNPQSMRMQSRFGVGADWPFSYQELEPFYLEAERILGVAGPNPDPSRPRSAPFPLPAHPLSYAGKKLQAGCQRLGLGWQPNTLAILSRAYDGRPPCNYCGNCSRGCPRTDKGSVDVTFVRRALATGHCTVLHECQATRIEAGKGDRILRVHYRDTDGSERNVSARKFIIACGAVETPRLLLTSSDSHSPDGLCNDEGLVGKNFMETLLWTSVGLHPDPLGSHRGVATDGICWDFNDPDAISGVIGGCRFNHVTAEANLLGPINYAQRIVPGWGRAHRRSVRAAFGRALAIGAIGESLPNPNSYIDLDPWKTDATGMPLARIHSRLTEMDIERLRFMAEKARQILQASGSGKIVEEYGTYDFFNSTHVFGTCRMGYSAADSVVDSLMRSHRWKNLWIMDASVFPSSGGGESPSLTIEALALRAVAHIKKP